MKRRYMAALCLSLAGVLLFGGCKETPKHVIVKQKGEQAVNNYQQEEESPLSAASSSEEGSARTALKEKLGVPDRYTNTVTVLEGKSQIVTDAEIELPDTQSFSTIQVSAEPLTQEWTDQMVYGLFPEGKIYTMDSYVGETKESLQKDIAELKAYIAQGNLDPYGYGTDENGNLVYDIYGSLAGAEARYLEAPATFEPQETKPILQDEANGQTFSGVVENPDGGNYSLLISSGTGASRSVKAVLSREVSKQEQQTMWREYSVDGNYSSSDGQNSSMDWKPSRDEMAGITGLTMEDAKAQADQIVNTLGISDLKVSAWDYALYAELSEDTSRDDIKDSGYYFWYTREIQNCPVTYTMSLGGGLESMESTIEPWEYERLEILITKDGMESFSYGNTYQVGAIQTENVKLLSFDEIIQDYEKMMQFQLSGYLETEGVQSYETEISRITLGYMRIYTPSENNRSGILVPVWDFFGKIKQTSVYENVSYTSESEAPYQSQITINAIDGTVIDRELGY